MIRLFFFLLLLTAAAVGLAWFADNPGSITINWLGREIETSVFQGALILAFALTAVILVIAAAVAIVTSPRRIARAVQMRRRRKGFKALQDGIFAVGAGDAQWAARCAGVANKFVPNKPLTRLLRAQAAQLTGDKAAAQRIFTSMLDDADTKLLGLRGLHLEAKREGQMEAALLYVEQALALNPALPWPSAALFDFQAQARNWQGALATIGLARAHRVLDRKTADRRRAVALTALAMESEERGDGKALDLAVEAHQLAPDLVPAAAIAGRALAAAGYTSKAARVLTETWRVFPHPDLATAYAYARPGDSPRDRLMRVKTLANETPGHPEAAVAIASAAVEARAWDEAREALHFLLLDNPSVRVCMLMARIESGEKRDAGRVREWLARALRAPKDPAWIADGVVCSEWAPLSPATNTFDAFVWDTPSERIRPGGLEERLLGELEKLDAGEEPLIDALDMAIEAEATSEPEAPQVSPARPEASPAPAQAAETSRDPAARPSSEPLRPAGTDIVVLSPAKPQSTSVAVSTPDGSRPLPAEETRPRAKARPQIFVADRAPDDPGPLAANDADEPETPLSRFRLQSKDPS